MASRLMRASLLRSAFLWSHPILIAPKGNLDIVYWCRALGPVHPHIVIICLHNWWHFPSALVTMTASPYLDFYPDSITFTYTVIKKYMGKANWYIKEWKDQKRYVALYFVTWNLHKPTYHFMAGSSWLHPPLLAVGCTIAPSCIVWCQGLLIFPSWATITLEIISCFRRRNIYISYIALFFF
jgi:hypothetical protein